MSSSDCRLHYVHIDERGDSVTLGFDAGPTSGTERFEFYLLFTGVVDLHVSGWTPPDAQEILIAPDREGGYAVSLGPQRSGVRFRATAVEVARTRTYLAFAEEARPADSRRTGEALGELALGRLYDDSLALGARLGWAKLVITLGGGIVDAFHPDDPIRPELRGWPAPSPDVP
ncbi:hypothetical protein EV284_2509 [Streptomyces sp. BK022]|uniref:hypothetical protein n=1 Tax=Streptomyces sp. BK022 TaxID=2512123 RepID=UPI00102A3E5E|nr:hypothetical protein [Streptomyces sp. BK022]RZU37343.1 hypothetical protein EV284_2509 [Streptomyces sp. BK022]